MADDPDARTQTMRDDAEKKLAGSPKCARDLTGQTAEELIHELQVHQIELEAQAEELRKSHLALEESRDKFLDLYEFAPLGYLTLNDKALVTDANLACATLLGVERSKLKKARFRKFVAQKDSEQWVLYFMNALNRDGKQTSTLTLIRGDGSTFPARLESIRLTGSDGAITVRIALSDITDIWQIEALMESEKKYRSLFENMLEGFAYCRMLYDKKNRPTDFIYLNVNPAFNRIIGTSVIMGKPVTEVFPKIKEAFPELFEIYGRVALTGEPESFDLEVKPSGKWLHISVYSTAKEHFVAVFEDITERKRTEGALQESESRYRTLAESSPDNIFIIAKDDTVQFVNSRAGRSLNLPEDEIIGKPRKNFFPPDIADWQGINLQKVFETGEPLRDERKIMYGDQEIWQDDALVPLRDETGNVTAVLGVSRDITKRKRAEENLVAALKRRQEQQAALALISFSPALLLGDVDGFSTKLTEESSGVLGVQRASVWLFDNNGEKLRCIDLYEASHNRHSRNLILMRHEYVNEFEAVKTANYIDADDPLTDPRTAGYVESYLKPNRITSMLDAVIRVSGQNLGVLCFEHVDRPHHWETDEIAFACQLADQIAITLLNHDRKRAEEALKNEKRRLASIIEGTRTGTWEWNVQTGETIFNKQWAEIIGYTLEEISPISIETWMKYAYPDDLQKSGELLERHFRRESESYEFESRMIHKKGHLVWVLDRGKVASWTDDGKPLWMFGTHQDITERKRAEKELWDSRQQFQGLVETLYDWVWEVDSNGRYTYVSPRIKDLLGYEPEELLGKIPFDIMPVEEAERVSETFGSLLAEQKSLNAIENICLHKDGHPVIMETNGLPFYDAEGNFMGYHGTDRDITWRKELEREMEYHAQELMKFSTSLAAANKKLTLLSSITRHDINNQLTVLMGYLTLLEQKKLDPTFNTYFQKVSTAAKRISAMIQFTGEYEKIGVNAPAWQDSRTLVNTAAKEAQLGKVVVKNDLPAGADIFADPLVVKVFYNLMDNAVRYGGKITTIRFSALESGDNYLIVCEDDGDGVTADEKEKIFERGFGKNTGLGLALSQEILDITGITICENGEPGKGARFEIVVPKGCYRMKQEDTV
jgi:PAS domain S-box-containing protein